MESCDPRFENLPDGGSGEITRCSKPPNDRVDGAVRQDGIAHWQGESLTLLGKTCNNNNNNACTGISGAYIEWLQRAAGAQAVLRASPRCPALAEAEGC